MNNKMMDLVITTVTGVVLGLSASQAQAAAKKMEMEKCYGVSKASKNDCGVKNGHSCAGLAKTDGSGDEYILVPKGTCSKIVGGSTTPKST